MLHAVLTTTRRLTQPAITLVMVAWPLIIGFGITHHALPWLLPVMALLLLIRLRQARLRGGPLRLITKSIAVTGIVLCVASLVLRSHDLLLWYPVVVNTLLLALFGGSLWSPMPLVERIARLKEPDLPPAGVRYTRRVTQLWCGFFMISGGVAAFTCWYGDTHLWTLWNGMIAYLLMGALMTSEWLVRQRVLRREAQ